MLFLLYQALFVWQAWSRVFTVTLGAVLWCNLLTTFLYLCCCGGIKLTFVNLAEPAFSPVKAPRPFKEDRAKEDRRIEELKFCEFTLCACSVVVFAIIVLVHDLAYDDTQSKY